MSGVPTVGLLAATASTGHIGWGGLAASTVLVAIAVGLSAVRHLGLGRSIVWASLRALVQLLRSGRSSSSCSTPTGRSCWPGRGSR